MSPSPPSIGGKTGSRAQTNLAWKRILELTDSGEGRQEVQPAIDEAPSRDFAADPNAVSAVAEAHRLAYGHLFNPAFATETSLIDPLPHQRIAVYEQDAGTDSASIPAGRRRGRRQDHHDRAIHPRNAVSPTHPPHTHRAARRSRRQLGTGDAKAVPSCRSASSEARDARTGNPFSRYRGRPHHRQRGHLGHGAGIQPP